MATDYEFLRQFCKSEKQKWVLEAVIKHGGNMTKAAKDLDRS